MNLVYSLSSLVLCMFQLNSCVTQNSIVVNEEKYNIVALSDFSINSISFQTNCEKLVSAFGKPDTIYIFNSTQNIVYDKNFDLYFQENDGVCILGGLTFINSEVNIEYRQENLTYSFSKETNLKDFKRVFPDSYNSMKTIVSSDDQSGIIKCLFQLNDELLSMDFEFRNELLVSVSVWFPYDTN